MKKITIMLDMDDERVRDITKAIRNECDTVIWDDSGRGDRCTIFSIDGEINMSDETILHVVANRDR